MGMKLDLTFERVTLDKKELVGVSSKAASETPELMLWGTFYKHFYEEVQNKLDEKVYEVYSEIATDPFACQVMIGCEVTEVEELPSITVKKQIPAGVYAKFKITGDVYEVVPEFWKQIEQANLPFRRSYICDFEEYPSSETKDVTLFIYLSIH